MMTDEQKSKVAELKASIASTAATPGGAPREVRKAVLSLKQELRRGGTTARKLAALLGTHETTLCRWEREEATRSGAKVVATSPTFATGEREASAGFRVVQMATPAPGALVPATVRQAARSRRSATSDLSGVSGRSLRVAHAPSGLVVDGLDVETLAALLRRLS
jgi:hypothetical protein